MAESLALETRVATLAQWTFAARHLVVFTGAGISTESGLPDFRGPDGLWTRQEKGLPAPKFDWSAAKPNEGHLAIVELQNMGKLAFLISQNVDNLHLKSGIHPELLAELHGNITKLRCSSCETQFDNFPDLNTCPLCGGRLTPSVVNFGQPLPRKDIEKAYYHSRQSDLFVVAGSSLVVYPAANMPEVAIESGAKLVIINQAETPLDSKAQLLFRERVGEVLPATVAQLRRLMAKRDD